ncbi:MAG TPA: antibiotic biosynthesis monooxygenase [Vicinamibacterales bacterium]|jgi:quinol monooxygenase YgiN|nr:antibiotic biosynthesis monooxygenase [Vicinamibacterales bacterium]
MRGLLTALLFSATLFAQTPPPDTTFYAVSYVETAAASAKDASASLHAFHEATMKQDGCTNVEAYEQIGRPGHWVIVETWRDQKAFDARDASVQQRLIDSTKTIRVSGFDQRPYKTIAVAAARPGAGGNAVSVISHVDVAPNPAVAPMLARLAQASRQEPGNLRFDVLQHTMRANHFTVIETWRDQAALDAHVAAAHTKQYRDEVQPLTGSPLDERVFKAAR